MSLDRLMSKAGAAAKTAAKPVAAKSASPAVAVQEFKNLDYTTNARSRCFRQKCCQRPDATRAPFVWTESEMEGKRR